MQTESFSPLNFENKHFGWCCDFAGDFPPMHIALHFRRKKRDRKRNNVMIEHYFVLFFVFLHLHLTSFPQCRSQTTWLLSEYTIEQRIGSLSSHSNAEPMMSNISLFGINSYSSCTCMLEFEHPKCTVIYQSRQRFSHNHPPVSSQFPSQNFASFFIYKFCFFVLCFHLRTWKSWCNQNGVRERKRERKSCRNSFFVQICVCMRYRYICICILPLRCSEFAGRCGLPLTSCLQFHDSSIYDCKYSRLLATISLSLSTLCLSVSLPLSNSQMSTHTHLFHFSFLLMCFFNSCRWVWCTIFFFYAHSDDILSAHFLQCRLPWTNWCIPIKNLILTSLLLLRFVSHIVCIYISTTTYMWVCVGVVHCFMFIMSSRLFFLSSVIRSHSLHFRRTLFRFWWYSPDFTYYMHSLHRFDKSAFSHHISLLPSLEMHFRFIWCAVRIGETISHIYLCTHVCTSNANKLKST